MKPQRLAKLIRIWTSLNWVIGSLALLAAIAGPLLYEHVYIAGFRGDVEAAVDAVAAGQRDELIVRERFLVFGHTGAEQPAFQNIGLVPASLFDDPRYRLDSTAGANGNLVVQGMTRPGALQSHWLPAVLFRHEIDGAGSTVSRGWVNGS